MVPSFRLRPFTARNCSLPAFFFPVLPKSAPTASVRSGIGMFPIFRVFCDFSLGSAAPDRKWLSR